MNKPAIFRATDLPALGAVAVLDVVAVAPRQDAPSLVATLFLCGAAILMTTLAVAFLVARAKLYAKIVRTTRHGLHLITHGFEVNHEAIEDLTEYTISEWRKRTKWTDTQVRDALVDTILVFEKCPFDGHASKGWMGLFHHRVTRVCYHNPVKQQIVCHNLGHVILSNLTDMGEMEQEEFLSKNNLP